MRDEIGSDEIGSEPPRSASPRVRRAVLALVVVAATAAYGPNLLGGDTPSSGAPAAAQVSAPPTPTPSLSAPPLPSAYTSSWSLLDVDTWPVRGNLARDAEFAEILDRRLDRLKLADAQTLWAGTVPGGRLALVALRLDTSVEVHAAFFPSGSGSEGSSRGRTMTAPLDFAGYLGRGWPRIAGWVGPSTPQGRPVVLVGAPEALSLRVSAAVDHAEDGTPMRRWQRHESGSGAALLVLDEPVSDPVVVCRAGGARALVLRFDPRPSWAGGRPAPVGVRACGSPSGPSL